MTQSHWHDPEFGDVVVRRSKAARHIKLKINQSGSVVLSMSPRTPLFLGKTLLEHSRNQIRVYLAKIRPKQTTLLPGDIIGKTHRLVLTEGAAYQSRLISTELHVTIPFGVDPQNVEAQLFIKQAALKALRTQAKAFLTRRLTALAQHHNFTFTTIRFSNAGTRWGSCSSRGTISLNIWLMQLPFELIDYVLIHELCHTRQMNHSALFWQLVENILPDYKTRRKLLKERHPYL